MKSGSQLSSFHNLHEEKTYPSLKKLDTFGKGVLKSQESKELHSRKETSQIQISGETSEVESNDKNKGEGNTKVLGTPIFNRSFEKEKFSENIFQSGESKKEDGSQVTPKKVLRSDLNQTIVQQRTPPQIYDNSQKKKKSTENSKNSSPNSNSKQKRLSRMEQRSVEVLKSLKALSSQENNSPAFKKRQQELNLDGSFRDKVGS